MKFTHIESNLDIHEHKGHFLAISYPSIGMSSDWRI